MKKALLKREIERGLSTHGLAQRFGLSQTTIRYWLKKHDLKTQFGPKGTKVPIDQKCYICTKVQMKKVCQSCRTKVRRYRTKLAAIKMLGGKCQRCAWVGDPAGFEFHHKEKDKDMTIGSVSNRSWSVVKKELRKCELLCSICHRIEHSNRADPRFIEVAERYKGTLLDIGTGS